MCARSREKESFWTIIKSFSTHLKLLTFVALVFDLKVIMQQWNVFVSRVTEREFMRHKTFSKYLNGFVCVFIHAF